MRLLHSNIVSEASLSLSSFVLGYGSERLVDKSPSTLTKMTGHDEEYIVLDFVEPRAVSALAIFNHNLTAIATVTVEGNSVNSWVAPAFSQSATVASGYILARFAPSSYRYWRIVFSDPSNTANIELGELFVGSDSALTYPATDGSFTYNEVSRRLTTRSGQIVGSRQYIARAFSFNLLFLDNAKRQALRDIFYANGSIEPIVLILWEDALDDEPPIYGVFDMDTLSLARRPTRAQIWNSAFTFREVI